MKVIETRVRIGFDLYTFLLYEKDSERGTEGVV